MEKFHYLKDYKNLRLKSSSYNSNELIEQIFQKSRKAKVGEINHSCKRVQRMLYLFMKAESSIPIKNQSNM